MAPPTLHAAFALLALPVAACLAPIDGDELDFCGDTDGACEEPREPIVITPRFELEGDDFFRSPWPSDARLLADGTIDLGDFPGGELPLLEDYRAALEHVVDGFSTNPVIYIPLDVAPAPEDWPEVLIDPRGSTRASAHVQLLDVSEEGCGARVPVHMKIEPGQDAAVDSFSSAPALAVTPVEGFVLRPRTTYALVVLRSFGERAGYDLRRPEPFDAALESDALYAPLRACLEREGESLQRAELAVATVFTTQDPVSEMRRVHDFVADTDALPPPEVSTVWLTAYEGYNGVEGAFEAPIFMRGHSPYVEGGGFEFDEDGLPIVQRWETVPFHLQMPYGPGPHPVLVWQGGTGWSEWSHLNDDLTRDLLDSGVAVLAFMPQFHGSRATPGSDEEISTYNYLNPEAGRTVIRQQAAEVVYAIRLIRESLPPMLELIGAAPLDGERLVYGAHSQGTTPGAILAALQSEFRAYMLSGAASYLSITITAREDYDIDGMIRAVLGIKRELDRFHPIVALAQLGVDALEPHNYARLWGGTPQRPAGANVLVINGFNDPTTDPIGMSYLTIAGDLAVIDPPGWDPDPYRVWDREPERLPIAGNRVGFDGQPHTLATVLHPSQGHFTLYNVPQVEAVAHHFLTTALAGAANVDLP